MTEPTPIRTRRPAHKGAIITVVVLFALAALGVVSTVILITLATTGQIG